MVVELNIFKHNRSESKENKSFLELVSITSCCFLFLFLFLFLVAVSVSLSLSLSLLLQFVHQLITVQYNLCVSLLIRDDARNL